MRRTVDTLIGPISAPLLITACMLALCIWCNSLVPGSESTQISLTVLDALSVRLGALGIPVSWITNLFVRKAGHVLEYLAFGSIFAGSFASRGPVSGRRAAVVASVFFLVPAIDEAIQLFVPGRSGMVTDVLLDCIAAACGALLVAYVFATRQKSSN